MDELPYRKLDVWWKANALAMRILDLADQPAFAKQYWFRDQLCSCAMSVPANIAEGHGRGTALDFAAFVDRARGSLFELDNWLFVANARTYVSVGEHEVLSALIGEVNAMLFALRESLRRQAAAGRLRR